MQRQRPLRADPGIKNRLWLRLKPLGFRRGATFRTFRLSFVKHDALLVVELDDGRSLVFDARIEVSQVTEQLEVSAGVPSNVETSMPAALAMVGGSFHQPPTAGSNRSRPLVSSGM